MGVKFQRHISEQICNNIKNILQPCLRKIFGGIFG